VFSALALLAALAAAMHFGRRLDLPSEKIWNLSILGILTTLLAARLLLVITNFGAFRSHPFWVLGLVPRHQEWVAYAAAALGMGAAWLYLMAEGLPVRRTLDAIAPALALGFGVQAIGAFCGGAGYGKPTHLPWAVKYHSLIAYLWYRTPLDVPLQPVQIYDALISLILFAALAFSLPRTRRSGEIAGFWLLAYGIARFFLDFYRGNAPAAGWLTAVQWVSLAAVVAGGLLLLRSSETSRPVEAAE
jgi:phosphatidylglycerol:prolipoprotein diacylglycerol transferase